MAAPKAVAAGRKRAIGDRPGGRINQPSLASVPGIEGRFETVSLIRQDIDHDVGRRPTRGEQQGRLPVPPVDLFQFVDRQRPESCEISKPALRRCWLVET